jgi:DNA-binding beta-propeller fold protein YncE
MEPKPEDLQSNGSDPVTLKLTTFDSKGIACKRGGDKVEGFVVSKSPIPGPAIKARVVDDNSGRYTLSFPSTYCGECELSIRVNGSEIRGSPFAVTLYRPPVWPKLSRNVRDIKVPKERLQFPYQPGGVYGVAISQNGTIFVSDCINREIHVFSKERKHMRVFGQQGSGEGQLNSPYGLAVDSEGLVYVANCSNHRIEVLREDGTFVRQIGAGQLKHPWNVTMNHQQVYIADSDNHRISIYTMQGQLVRHIGERGSGPGQFKWPGSVACSPDGDMYISDTYNNRIQVLDANGQFKREFGKGELRNPRDLVITADGDVLVADQSSNRVAVFDSRGNANNLVHSFKVNNPLGLAIDSDGDILVTDNTNKQVVIF